MTFSFVSKLAEYNIVKFIDHYDYFSNNLPQQKERSHKEKIYLLILKYMSNVKLRWLKTNEWRKPEFLYEEYGIEREEAPRVDEGIYLRYSFRLENVKNNSILLYESDHTDNDSIINYEKTIISIVKSLREKGFNIYLKPHSRLGYSKIIEDYVLRIIPHFITGEFINMNKFMSILGVETVTIANYARRKHGSVYSLISLFEYRNKQECEMYKNYLVEQSNGNIKFVDSLDDLIEELQRISKK